MEPQQFILAQARPFGALACLPGDAFHRAHQPDDFARRPVRLGILVTGEPLPQVPGLADVKHQPVPASHDIHARLAGCRTEKRLPQPLHERFGRGEEVQLPRWHGHNLSQSPAAGPRAGLQGPILRCSIW